MSLIKEKNDEKKANSGALFLVFHVLSFLRHLKFEFLKIVIKTLKKSLSAGLDLAGWKFSQEYFSLGFFFCLDPKKFIYSD